MNNYRKTLKQLILSKL